MLTLPTIPEPDPNADSKRLWAALVAEEPRAARPFSEWLTKHGYVTEARLIRKATPKQAREICKSWELVG